MNTADIISLIRGMDITLNKSYGVADHSTRQTNAIIRRCVYCVLLRSKLGLSQHEAGRVLAIALRRTKVFNHSTVRNAEFEATKMLQTKHPPFMSVYKDCMTMFEERTAQHTEFDNQFIDGIFL